MDRIRAGLTQERECEKLGAALRRRLDPSPLRSDEGNGKAYGAKTTPDMRVIDSEGRIIYADGIDDKPTNKVEHVQGAKNFVRTALDVQAAGRPVAPRE